MAFIGVFFSCSLWNNVFAQDTTEYSLADYEKGRAAALADAAAGRRLIYSAGSPEWAMRCRLCNYKAHGYEFMFTGCILTSQVEGFNAGYNSISREALRKQIGDSAYARLDSVDAGRRSISALIREQADNRAIRGFFEVKRLTDSTHNIRFCATDFFRGDSVLAGQIRYTVSGQFRSRRPEEITRVYSARALEVDGAVIFDPHDPIRNITLRFDYTGLEGHPEYCMCGSEDEGYYFMGIPFREEE